MTSSHILDFDMHHVYVIGDFGRASTFTFCNRFIETERQLIEKTLSNQDFYDEYRRSMITVHSYLPWIKAKQIHEQRKLTEYLDDRILIGFPDGMALDEAIENFCVMVISFLKESMMTCAKQIITLPCNTLSPAISKIEEIMNNHDQMMEIIKRNNIRISSEDALQLSNNKSIKYITVADAVMTCLAKNNFKYVLPLGTSDISNIYSNTTSKTNNRIEVLRGGEKLQKNVFNAIKACIKNSPKEIEYYKKVIFDATCEYGKHYNKSVAIVEACTDLKLGIGYNSLDLYADNIAELIYLDESKNA